MKYPISYSDSYGKATIRTTSTIKPHVWFPSTNTPKSELVIKGIDQLGSYTDLILSFDIASNAATGSSSLTHISVSYAQKATPDIYQLITLPAKAFGSQNVFISITDIDLPDGVTSLKFYYDASKGGSGYRLDNVVITGLQ